MIIIGVLKNELIRDRIVVGLKGKKLSEKLQLDSKLTLEKAVTQARQSEPIKKQQDICREPNQTLPQLMWITFRRNGVKEAKRRIRKLNHPKTLS